MPPHTLTLNTSSLKHVQRGSACCTAHDGKEGDAGEDEGGVYL